MTDFLDTLSGLAVIGILAFCAWVFVELVEDFVLWLERRD